MKGRFIRTIRPDSLVPHRTLALLVALHVPVRQDRIGVLETSAEKTKNKTIPYSAGQ